MIIERDRDDYARAAASGGYKRKILIEAPLLVELNAHVPYARDLLTQLEDALAAWGTTEVAEIKVDLPVSIAVNRAQIEQLVERLTKDLA